jgi:phenylacetate-CoA ligase
MTDWYAVALERVLWPLWESGIRRRPTLAYLRYLQQTQWRSSDELHATQAGDLRRLLRHAYARVPFYRARFDALGISPDDIRGPEDLGALPLLTRAEAIDSYQQRRAIAPPLPTISKATSGTTGQPLAFGYDPCSEHWRQAVKLRGYGWAGYRVGQRVLFYWGAPIYPLPPLQTRVKTAVDHFIKRERYIPCAQRTVEDLDRLIEVIKQKRPQAVVCYALTGADLARHILARGARSWGTIPVICGAESLYPSDREALEAAFGPKVFETYGCREVMLIASECELHQGLHLSSENLVVELIVSDRKGQRPAQPGEVGEVVITDLHNFGMPFIRYANGDRAVAAPATPCPCGRSLPRLAAVEGRLADTLCDGNGGRVSGLVFPLIFAVHAAAVKQFQAVQHRDRSITLKLVPAASFDGVTRACIERNCARYLPGVPVQIELVADTPLAKNGKRRVVVVEN